MPSMSRRTILLLSLCIMAGTGVAMPPAFATKPVIDEARGSDIFIFRDTVTVGEVGGLAWRLISREGGILCHLYHHALP